MGVAALADGSVGPAKLASGAVGVAALVDGAVGAAAIAAEAVGASELAADSVGTSELGAGAVTGGKLAAGAVGSADLAAGAVTGAAVLDGSLTAADLAVEVMSGPGNGMFINTSDNERRGEAFVLVQRKDHDLHVYGTGKDRRIVVVPHADGGGIPSGGRRSRPRARSTATTTHRDRLRSPQRDVHQPLGQRPRRRGLRARRAQGPQLHIYGTGKDRRVIVARYGDATAAPAAGDAAEATPATGGAAAPDA